MEEERRGEDFLSGVEEDSRLVMEDDESVVSGRSRTSTGAKTTAAKRNSLSRASFTMGTATVGRPRGASSSSTSGVSTSPSAKAKSPAYPPSSTSPTAPKRRPSLAPTSSEPPIHTTPPSDSRPGGVGSEVIAEIYNVIEGMERQRAAAEVATNEELQTLSQRVEEMQASINKLSATVTTDMADLRAEVRDSIDRLQGANSDSMEEVRNRVEVNERFIGGHNGDLTALRDLIYGIEKNGERNKELLLDRISEQERAIQEVIKTAEGATAEVHRIIDKKINAQDNRLTDYSRSLEKQLAGLLKQSFSRIVTMEVSEKRHEAAMDKVLKDVAAAERSIQTVQSKIRSLTKYKETIDSTLPRLIQEIIACQTHTINIEQALDCHKKGMVASFESLNSDLRVRIDTMGQVLNLCTDLIKKDIINGPSSF